MEVERNASVGPKTYLGVHNDLTWMVAGAFVANGLVFFFCPCSKLLALGYTKTNLPGRLVLNLSSNNAERPGVLDTKKPSRTKENLELNVASIGLPRPCTTSTSLP